MFRKVLGGCRERAGVRTTIEVVVAIRDGKVRSKKRSKVNQGRW